MYEANGTTERTLPDYLSYSVTYSDGVAVAVNQKLSANSTETYKVRVEYKTDIEASQIPSSAGKNGNVSIMAIAAWDCNITSSGESYCQDIGM